MYGNEKIVNLNPVFYLIRWDGGFWFRFFKRYGLHAKDTTRSIELFSERHGHAIFLQVGKWRFKLLKP